MLSSTRMNVATANGNYPLLEEGADIQEEAKKVTAFKKKYGGIQTTDKHQENLERIMDRFIFSKYKFIPSEEDLNEPANSKGSLGYKCAKYCNFPQSLNVDSWWMANKKTVSKKLNVLHGICTSAM